MYGKIFSSMYDGSLYGQWQAIVTFQQMIVLCNKDGILDMTPQALSARTSIPFDIIKAGLEQLEKPDQYSRTRDHDGRRIELIDGARPWGWRIINYRKYRMMVTAEQKREADRIRIAVKRAAEVRAATKSDAPLHDATKSDETRQSQMSQNVANVAQAEAEAEAVKSRGRASRFLLSELPADWAAWCRSERQDIDPQATFDRFGDYWRAKPGKDGRKVDWLATWRNWVRNERAPPPGERAGSPPQEKPWWTPSPTVL